MRWVYVQNPAFKQLLNFENDPFVIRTAFAIADNFKLPFSIDDEICIGLQHAKEYSVLYNVLVHTYVVLKYYYFIDVFHVTQKHSYVSPVH